MPATVRLSAFFCSTVVLSCALVSGYYFDSLSILLAAFLGFGGVSAVFGYLEGRER